MCRPESDLWVERCSFAAMAVAGGVVRRGLRVGVLALSCAGPAASASASASASMARGRTGELVSMWWYFRLEGDGAESDDDEAGGGWRVRGGDSALPRSSLCWSI